MLYDLGHFTPADAKALGSALDAQTLDASTMEQAARRMVRHLYHHLVDADTEEKCCALVRFFKTHRYGELELKLQRFASRVLHNAPISADARCLTLLASAGDRPEWNDRSLSHGHQALPLPNAILERSPMIARLIAQLGIDVGAVIDPNPNLIIDHDLQGHNVFHVPEALGSPYVPAQDHFVVRYGIRSVLGFGGLLPAGDLYAVIMFSKTPISAEAASNFKDVSFGVRRIVLPFTYRETFDPTTSRQRDKPPNRRMRES